MLRTIPKQFFGHHHVAPKKYDFRDDPEFNIDYTVNFRHKNSILKKTSDQWTYPLITEQKESQILTNWDDSKGYKFTDISKNFTYNATYPSYQDEKQMDYNIDEECDHELDYESEDFDIVSTSQAAQHYRKKGPYWIWVFVGFFPAIFYMMNFGYSKIPDGNHFKINRPPPLDYPDDMDTDDTQTIKDFNTYTARRMYEKGIIQDLYFDIIDGRKVYRKREGVNQPDELW